MKIIANNKKSAVPPFYLSGVFLFEKRHFEPVDIHTLGVAARGRCPAE
jgi:hypothetical protein